MKYVALLGYFNDNCPIHDGISSYSLKKFDSIQEMKDYALTNLNATHIVEIISDEEEICFKYFSASHQFVEIKLYVNDKLISQTQDNGSGKRIWSDI